jgi:bacterioferritin-associated ferredoxin
MPNRTFVCRCSDITLEEIRELIEQGYQTIDEIKRISRLGMGPCGGKTCTPLIMAEIARARGIRPAEVEMATFRPPTKNIKLDLLAKAGEGDE